MTIEILVNFTDNDYVITQFNGSLLDAKEYYKGNVFTDSNENNRTCVGVWLYDEWKCDVLQNCLDNNNTALHFDDDKELFTFKTPQNDLITLSYEKVNYCLNAVQGWTFCDRVGSGWEHGIFETKDKAIQAAKEHFKTSAGRFIEVGWMVNINNQLNVVRCEKLEF